MSLIDEKHRLTQPDDPDFGERLRQTHKGMAHFATTGPQGETCRTCQHWQCEGYLAANGELKKGRCGKFAALTRQVGDKVVHYAKACKYHERAEKPPSIYVERGK